MTIPSYVAAGALASGVVATITPGLPAGIATNDILICEAARKSEVDPLTITNQNGGTWAEITPSHSGNAHRGHWFWSRYNGTQGAPTVGTADVCSAARIIAIRGAIATGNPIEGGSGDAPTFAETTSTLLSITTLGSDRLIVLGIVGELPDAAGTNVYGTWTNANLANLTERIDGSVAEGTGLSLGIATGEKAAQGVIGTSTVVHASFRVAFKTFAIIPAVEGTPPPDEGSGVSKNAKGQLTIGGVPKFIRLIYDSGFAGVGGTDMAGHLTARVMSQYTNKLNAYLNVMSGTSQNGLALADALGAYGMYVLAVGNAFGTATVEAMSAGNGPFDVVVNASGFRANFALKARALGIYLADEPADSIQSNVLTWHAIYKAAMPNLVTYTVLIQNEIYRLLDWAPRLCGDILASDPYPIGAASEAHPDGGSGTNTYGYMNFDVAEAAANIRYHALRNNKIPAIICQMLKFGDASRFPKNSEWWSWMVAVAVEGCMGIGWWAFGVQDGALDQRPFIVYNGNNSNVTFAYAPMAGAAGDVEVKVGGVIQAGSAYTVNNVGTQGGGTVTMNTAPPTGTGNVVVTVNRWPATERTRARTMLETMSGLLATLEPMLLSDPEPTRITANSLTTGNAITWRRAICNVLQNGGGDRPCWLFSRVTRYADEYTRLGLATPDTTLSAQMLDQSADVRTRCWEFGGNGWIFAYNLHPDPHTNVDITWYKAITRVEVIDEARDATIQGDGRTFRDTFGGSSSAREGSFRQGHVYKLYFGTSTAQVVAVAQVAEVDSTQPITSQQQHVVLGFASEVNAVLTPVLAILGTGVLEEPIVVSTIERLFTGDKHVLGKGTIDDDGRITVIQDQPYPITVLALFGEIEFGE